MKMTLGTLLEEGKEKLEKAGVPDPLLDAPVSYTHLTLPTN